MTQRLTDMQVTRVSLVDKGANARRFAVLKRDEEGSMTDLAEAEGRSAAASWLQKAADWLTGKTEPVVKVATFAEIVAGAELRDALYDSWYTLEDALWSAIYATDGDGQALPMEDKQALVAQDLDEFKTYLLAQMAGPGIAKRDASAGARARASVEAVVEKVGRKISGSRLERLQAAAEALTSVLDEVNEAVAQNEGDEPKEDTVEKAELVAAFTEALEPVNKRLEALEAKAPVAKADPPTGSEPEDEPEDGELSLATVVEAITKLADRIEAIEDSRGVRKSVAGQDGGTEPVKKSGVFSGILE
jgi:hypothetical protein